MEKRKSHISFFGIGLGSIALILALIHFWAGPFAPQPSLEQTVAEKAVAIKQATISALKGENPPAPIKRKSYNIDDALQIITAVLGGLALIAGVLGYAKKEPLSVAGGAAILGISAIAFQFMAVALGILVVTILVAAVLSGMGIG